jgi:hypothetical protein
MIHLLLVCVHVNVVGGVKQIINVIHLDHYFVKSVMSGAVILATIILSIVVDIVYVIGNHHQHHQKRNNYHYFTRYPLKNSHMHEK